MSETVAVDTGGERREGARTVSLRIPARLEYVALCRLALTGLVRLRALPDGLLAELKLAVTETVSNAVRHASGVADGRHVGVTYELHARKLVVEVTDESSADELSFEPRPDGAGARLRFSRDLTPT